MNRAVLVFLFALTAFLPLETAYAQATWVDETGGFYFTISEKEYGLVEKTLIPTYHVWTEFVWKGETISSVGTSLNRFSIALIGGIILLCLVGIAVSKLRAYRASVSQSSKPN